ncbi:MAG: DNA repair protein RecO [Myxococcales bacterium]|nr:DNA repair protein RecO [Myxococcales bacterium]
MLLKVELRDEADKRLALLGEERGLFWVTAKGARKSKRRFVGVLEPFTRGVYRVARYGKGEYLDSVQVTGARDRIPGDLGRYYVACYACELATRLLRVGTPAPGYFELVTGLLDDLQASEETAHQLWRAVFEAGVLELQGLWPAPTMDVEGAEWLAVDVTTGEIAVGSAPEPGEAEAPPVRGAQVMVSALLWEVFERLRQIPLAEARRLAPPVAELRPINRLTALMVRDQLQLELNSVRLLNQFQKRALEAAQAAAAPAEEPEDPEDSA